MQWKEVSFSCCHCCCSKCSCINVHYSNRCINAVSIHIPCTVPFFSVHSHRNATLELYNNMTLMWFRSLCALSQIANRSTPKNGMQKEKGGESRRLHLENYNQSVKLKCTLCAEQRKTKNPMYCTQRGKIWHKWIREPKSVREAGRSKKGFESKEETEAEWTSFEFCVNSQRTLGSNNKWHKGNQVNVYNSSGTDNAQCIRFCSTQLKCSANIMDLQLSTGMVPTCLERLPYTLSSLPLGRSFLLSIWKIVKSHEKSGH